MRLELKLSLCVLCVCYFERNMFASGRWLPETLISNEYNQGVITTLASGHHVKDPLNTANSNTSSKNNNTSSQLYRKTMKDHTGSLDINSRPIFSDITQKFTQTEDKVGANIGKVKYPVHEKVDYVLRNARNKRQINENTHETSEKLDSAMKPSDAHKGIGEMSSEKLVENKQLLKDNSAAQETMPSTQGIMSTHKAASIQGEKSTQVVPASTPASILDALQMTDPSPVTQVQWTRKVIPYKNNPWPVKVKQILTTRFLSH